MTRRVLALAGYFVRSLLFSLGGSLHILLALASWLVFFPPNQLTPHADYHILLLAGLGGVFTFLATFTIASRANHAMHYPLLVRLPSRVEYLWAVLVSALVFGTALQLLVAILATFHGPTFTLWHILVIPIVWLPINGLLAVLALHASDLVADGWSRIYVYGVLLALAIGQKINYDYVQPLQALPIKQVLGAPFWPFQAIIDAIQTGSFSPAQSLAPVVLALCAAFLFALASQWFMAKDLVLAE